MVSTKVILGGVLAMGVLAGCANQPNTTASAPPMELSGRTITDTIEFRGGIGGIAFAAGFNKVNNMLAICGTQTTIGNLRRPLARAVMNDFGVTVNDKLVLSDMAYFTQVENRGALLGTKGNCRLTTATWDEYLDADIVGLKSLGSGSYSL